MKNVLPLCATFLLCSYVSGIAGVTAFKREPDTAALWNFEESDGIPYQDQGPAGINLEPVKEGESDPGWKEGKFGKALSLPGGVRLIPATNTAPIKIKDEVTVEAWIFISPGADNPAMGIVQYSNYLKSGFRLGIEPDGALAWLAETGDTEAILRSSKNPKRGEWVHVAGTYDGRDLKIFINGKKEGELAFPGAVIQPEDNSNLMIGYLSSSSRPYFVGEINGVRISSKAHKEFKLK